MSNFRPMRRHRQQLPDNDCIGILERATAGTLALLGDDGYPYAVPISFVYHEGCIYFHSAVEGHKVDAIRRNEKASFCVIDQDEVHGELYTTFFRSVIAFGRIRIIEDEEEKLAAVRLLGNRYNPGQDEALQKEMEKGLHRMLALCLKIEHLTGKEAIELTRRKG
ncbi:MAG: pyridoxamine 5'-phosphate oxidase family protein [Prevotella sp.]|nr:pyridoxamine 5'-phosphate oxidase family protein [Prevotella sp.]